MNYALPLYRPAPIRLGRVLIVAVALWLASAVSFAPTVVRSAVADPTHAQLCKCAHCPGGKMCCCSKTAHCPTP